MSNSSIDQKVKATLVNREVIQNVSYLVSDLSSDETYMDELSSILSSEDYFSPVDWYVENDMTVRECYDYIDGTIMEYVKGNAKTQLVNWLEDDDDNYTKFAEDNNIDSEQNEALEHWLVSDHFGRKLEEKGEVVGEFKGLTIWGRTCSGQAISMDDVINDIAKDMEILEGMDNHKYWSE